MTMPRLRAFVGFTLSLAGCATGVDDVADLDAAVAGLSLRAELPALALADGELVALDLTDEQEASLECGDDERRSQLWLGPLQLGERDLAAAVLEVACDGEHASPQLSLRAPGEPLFGGDELPLRAPERAPEATCDAAGTVVCVPCGGIGMRTRTTVVTNYDPYTNHCSYGYTYGGCSPSACKA